MPHRPERDKMVEYRVEGTIMTEITNMADVAKFVREVRKAQKVSQTVLAQAPNVGLRFVGDIERGKPSIQFDKLLAVLTSLGISLKLHTFG